MEDKKKERRETVTYKLFVERAPGEEYPFAEGRYVRPVGDVNGNVDEPEAIGGEGTPGVNEDEVDVTLARE